MTEQLVLPVVFSWECPHCSYATVSVQDVEAHPAKCRRWLPSLFEVHVEGCGGCGAVHPTQERCDGSGIYEASVPCRDIVNIRTELV